VLSLLVILVQLLESVPHKKPDSLGGETLGSVGMCRRKPQIKFRPLLLYVHVEAHRESVRTRADDSAVSRMISNGQL
jgi:hypothetical protein